MKKVLKVLGWILIIMVLGFFGFLTYEINLATTNLVSQEETIKNETKYLDQFGINPDEFKNQYNYQEVMVKNESEDYEFPVEMYEMDGDKDVFIFIHGMGGTAQTMIPYSELFLEEGYSAVAFDQRNSGKHPVQKNNMGIKEKTDLISVIDYLKTNYPEKEISVFAESYGAQTFLQAYPDIKDDIKLIVLDSPMSDEKYFMEEGLKEAADENNLPFELFTFLGNIGARVIEGYSYNEMKSLEAIDKIGQPILIITAEDDDVVPFGQAAAIYGKAGTYAEILLSQSKHAEMVLTEKDRYSKAISTFLEKYN